MQKIMFNDRYGLTAAVLEGRKTQTRRMISALQNLPPYSFTLSEFGVDDKGKAVISAEFEPNEFVEIYPKYQIGEIVAVAQSYEIMANGGYLKQMTVPKDNAVGFDFKKEYCGKGYNNKMFVRADLMPHQIRIENIRYERLRDISDEDCIAEGVRCKYYKELGGAPIPCGYTFDGMSGIVDDYLSPRQAYAALIDKISGKGTWESNPWVFVYEFELIN